jgi:Protein kinase domain
MDAERWQRVERLYHDTLEREPAERAAFLRKNCADEALCREVEEMLVLAEKHAGFLERPALEIAVDRDGMTANRLHLAFEAAVVGVPGGPGNEFRLEPGARLGPYEVIEPAGAGGMGEVYRARDTRLNRVVALKVLTARLMEQAGIRRRFQAEAEAISSLNHPNICTLYNVGHQEDTDYLVMEYLEGQTLAARLKQGPLPYAELLRVGIEVAGALDYAHRRDPPGREARQHHAHRFRRQTSGLRAGALRAAGRSARRHAVGGEFFAHTGRLSPGHAAVYGARADRAPRSGRAHGHLRTGRGHLRNGRRSESVRRRHPCGNRGSNPGW